MKINKNFLIRYRHILVFAMVVATLGIFFVAFRCYYNHDRASDQLKVGFIMIGGRDADGWNTSNYEGIRDAAKRTDARLFFEENVKEDNADVIAAIRRLAEKGVSIIIFSSYNYTKEANQVMQNYPNISFYANSGDYYTDNLTSFSIKMYQARYMSGLIAGSKTKTGHIGYVASMSNQEVNRGINAFTLGVRKVNPKAVVDVMFTDSWKDPKKEREAVDRLVASNRIDVVTYHQDDEAVIREAEKLGIYSIGFHQQNRDYSSKNLCSVVNNWDIVYYKILRDYKLEGGNYVRDYWLGMTDGATGLSSYSSEVSEAVAGTVEEAMLMILSDEHIFSGEIYDNSGFRRCRQGEQIREEDLLHKMDWFVKGVVIHDS
ncbi:MAG: BMP family ABC transporter substrate-binding protein [Lachnospiraceae bacterium]|nr:BMP family ABC transporter substrate-binding protein [Lachnospiraceae bacterium]